MKSNRKDFMSYLLDQEDEDGLVNEQFLVVSASTFVYVKKKRLPREHFLPFLKGFVSADTGPWLK